MALECAISQGRLAYPFEVLAEKVGEEEAHDFEIVDPVGEGLPAVEALPETESCTGRFNAEAISNHVATKIVARETPTCPFCRKEIVQIRLDIAQKDEYGEDESYEIVGEERVVAISQKIALALRVNGSVSMTDVMQIQEVRALNRERVSSVNTPTTTTVSSNGEDEECCVDGCKDQVGIIGLIAIIIFAIIALFRAIANLFVGSVVTDDSTEKNRIDNGGTLVDSRVLV